MYLKQIRSAFNLIWWYNTVVLYAARHEEGEGVDDEDDDDEDNDADADDNVNSTNES